MNPSNTNSTYAKLGESCHTNSDCLVSNEKYLSPTDPVYKIMYTKTYLYPSPEYEQVKYEEKSNGKNVKDTNAKCSSCSK